jgi:ArsR family transcriptional regulator
MTSEMDHFRKAIADDTRWALMEHLCCVWLNVTELVEKLGGKVNQPTVSHHLKKLEEAGLVQVRQEGRQRYYTLNREVADSCWGMVRVSLKLDSDVISPDSIPVQE